MTKSTVKTAFTILTSFVVLGAVWASRNTPVPVHSHTEARDTETGVKIARRMQKWVCTFCGWVYDPEVGVPDEGISPGTDFMDLPLDFVCPVSGHPWDDFEIL